MGAWPADHRLPAFHLDTSAKYPLLATCSEDSGSPFSWALWNREVSVVCAALDGQLSEG